MFPRLPARATFAADTNFVSGTQKMFLILFRNILCPQQMFPSLHAQGNIMSNNVSATMCPRLPPPYIALRDKSRARSSTKPEMISQSFWLISYGHFCIFFIGGCRFRVFSAVFLFFFLTALLFRGLESSEWKQPARLCNRIRF